jgi:hypothetical protein
LYGILGEDDTDAETLKAIVAKMVGASVKIHTKGFGGKDKLLNKGSGQITFFRAKGCMKFIVCHDSDCDDPSINYAKVSERIVKPAGIPDECCILIPVHMIEAWILANIEAVSNVIRSWKPKPIANPEKITNPKSELKRLSRTEGGRPLYSHETHNQQVAKHLDLAIVEKKCPSFRPLVEFMRQG